MHTPRRDPRLVEVNSAHREWLAGIVEQHGVAEACRQSELGPTAVLGVVAKGKTMRAQAVALGVSFARRAGGVTA